MNRHLEAAISLCKDLYDVLSPEGYFVALTGGTLYKEGERKDIDLIIYRHRVNALFEINELEPLLEKVGLHDFRYFGFVTKCKWGNTEVDILHPETSSGNSNY